MIGLYTYMGTACVSLSNVCANCLSLCGSAAQRCGLPKHGIPLYHFPAPRTVNCERGELHPVYPTFSQIEGLFGDINFSTKVTRDTLEEICADLFERVKNPVRDVLRTTEITMVRSQVSSWCMWLPTFHLIGTCSAAHL